MSQRDLAKRQRRSHLDAGSPEMVTGRWALLSVRTLVILALPDDYGEDGDVHSLTAVASLSDQTIGSTSGSIMFFRRP